jgi:hypothetical protein
VTTASVTFADQSSAVCHLPQHDRRDLRRRVVAPAHAHRGIAVRRGDDLVRAREQVALHLGVVELASHQALDRVDRVLGVGHRLAPRGLADQALAGLREADHRRRGPRSLGVGDHDRRVAVDHRDARVGRAEVDPDDPGHEGSAVLFAFATTTSAGRSKRSPER